MSRFDRLAGMVAAALSAAIMTAIVMWWLR
jgi:hypothetical protein